jgi:hypothetical protein
MLISENLSDDFSMRLEVLDFRFKVSTHQKPHATFFSRLWNIVVEVSTMLGTYLILLITAISGF